MQVDLFWLVGLVANVSIVVFTLLWRKKEKSHETSIATIASLFALFSFLVNSCNEEKAKKELNDILSKQTKEITMRMDNVSNITNNKLDSLSKQRKVTSFRVDNSSDQEITLDVEPIIEKKLTVSGSVESQIYLRKGDKVFIKAFGSILLGPYLGYTGPNGKETGLLGMPLADYNIVSSFQHGALIYKIGIDGEWAECGAESIFTTEKEGLLIFGVNDNELQNNNGFFTVIVKVYR